MKNTSGNTEQKIFNLLKYRQINNIHHFSTGARFVSTTYISEKKENPHDQHESIINELSSTAVST
jgi:hypothetical protein